MEYELEIHEAADIFPLDEENLDDLAADIRAHGQQVPIELLGGKILDGRRRHLACKRAGVAPVFHEVQTDDPVARVMSLNLHRRHLTTSQKALAAARAREWYDRQARERQREAGRVCGRGQEKVPVNLPEANTTGDSRDQAAKAVGVSGKTVDYATRVLRHGVPEVIQAVEQGRMAVSTAAILSAEPPEVQREEATRPKRNRRYEPQSAPAPAEPAGEGRTPGKLAGVGIIRANEAINCLTRIPKNDALRKRGFQLVTDWIRHNP